ncbi:MAG TPA: ABC transporter permease [Terriglobales bacterium]|nr:ABC transporter permease [Terriglobales bacterium]
MSPESLIQDVCFGARVLFRRPAFTIVIVVVLALGIGANTAIFSVVDAVLLQPLPYRDSDRLVLVWQSSKEHRATGEWFNTYREFQEWQRSSRSLENLAALTWALSEKTLAWRGKTESVLAIPASLDFFSMLGVNAAVGRTFEQSDLNEGCAAVLSHAFWQNEIVDKDGKPSKVRRINNGEKIEIYFLPKGMKVHEYKKPDYVADANLIFKIKMLEEAQRP